MDLLSDGEQRIDQRHVSKDKARISDRCVSLSAYADDQATTLGIVSREGNEGESRAIDAKE